MTDLEILKLVERIVADDFCEDTDMRMASLDLSSTERTIYQKLSAIYRLVHSHIPDHECHHVHADWRKLAEEMSAEVWN